MNLGKVKETDSGRVVEIGANRSTRDSTLKQTVHILSELVFDVAKTSQAEMGRFSFVECVRAGLSTKTQDIRAADLDDVLTVKRRLQQVIPETGNRPTDGSMHI